MEITAVFDLDGFESLEAFVEQLNALPTGIRNMLAGRYAYEGLMREYSYPAEMRNDYFYGEDVQGDAIFQPFLTILQENGCLLDEDESLDWALRFARLIDIEE